MQLRLFALLMFVGIAGLTTSYGFSSDQRLLDRQGKSVSSDIAAVSAGTWTLVESPTDKDLNGMAMQSPTSGWAVGQSGTILRWNGQVWTQLPALTMTDLNGIAILDPTDGWIVGKGGKLLRFYVLPDGQEQWLVEPGPTSRSLWAISARGSDWALSVGDEGSIMQWSRGGGWSNNLSDRFRDQVFAAVGVTPADSDFDAWLGGRSILHLTALGWDEVAKVPLGGQLRDLQMLSLSDGWAVGDYNTASKGLVMRWDERAWTLSTTLERQLFAVSALGPDKAWVAGAAGAIYEFDGAAWTAMTTPITSTIHDLVMFNSNEGWAVGDNGVILRYSRNVPSTPASTPEPTSDRPGVTPTLPRPTSTSTPSPTKTATATSTATPSPTRTPRPGKVFLPLSLRDPSCPPIDIFADIVLVIDASTSMNEFTERGRTKIGAAVDAAKAFINGGVRLNHNGDQVAIVAFNDQPFMLQELTSDRNALFRALDDVTVNHFSRVELGIFQATIELLGPGHRIGHTRAMVVLSDGKANPVPGSVAVNAAERAKQAGVVVYVVGIGPSMDREILHQMASTPERFWAAQSAEDLSQVYHDLVVKVLCPHELYWGRR